MLPFSGLKLVCSNAEYEYHGLLLHTNLKQENQFLSLSNKHTSTLEKYIFGGKEPFKVSVKHMRLKNHSLKVFFFSFCEQKWWAPSLRYSGLLVIWYKPRISGSNMHTAQFADVIWSLELWNKREDKGNSMKRGAWKSSEMWNEDRLV